MLHFRSLISLGPMAHMMNHHAIPFDIEQNPPVSNPQPISRSKIAQSLYVALEPVGESGDFARPPASPPAAQASACPAALPWRML